MYSKHTMVRLHVCDCMYSKHTMYPGCAQQALRALHEWCSYGSFKIYCYLLLLQCAPCPIIFPTCTKSAALSPLYSTHIRCRHCCRC
jgi:hypothetical protein